MKPQDFVKEYSRLCDAYRLPQEFACRKDCPFIDMGNVNINHPERFEKAYNIVEKWSDTHPVKTSQNEFLKIFPKAAVRDGVIFLCPKLSCRTLLGTDLQGAKRLIAPNAAANTGLQR